jgi:hypothetical protein
MKELGIVMDFWSQMITIDVTTLPVITSTICETLDASTLRLPKLDDSLAKELISTHAIRAIWTLAQKADLQLIVKHNCKHLSANHQRSYCSFFI